MRYLGPRAPNLTAVYPCGPLIRNAGVPRTSWHAHGRLLYRDEGLFKDEKAACVALSLLAVNHLWFEVLLGPVFGRSSIISSSMSKLGVPRPATYAAQSQPRLRLERGTRLDGPT